MSDERRIRRLCLIALGVLLPAALWTHAHEDVMRAWQAHAFKAIDVAPAQTVRFADVSWRLTSLEATQNPKTPETTEITVRMQMEIASPEALRGCHPYMEDASGQRWGAVPPKSRDISCSNLSFRADANTKQVEIMERFRVPTARASQVTLAIVMPKERPRYLRFQRPAP